MPVDKTWLSKWFVDSYLRKCFHLCPDNIARLFHDVSTTTKLQNAVSATVAWKFDNSLLDLWNASDFIEYHVCTSAF